MRSNAYAYFSCRAKHESRDEDDLRLKYIAMCTVARNRDPRVVCGPAARDNQHDTGDGEEDEECPECKGDTPPETP